jgi:DNA polymerase (family 10)
VIDNARIAERLESLPSCSSWPAPAHCAPYRRAEPVRETRAPVAELVRAGRVQELRGIGPGIAARLTELVETGSIAELEELEREVQPQLVGFGRLLGIGPQRMLEIGRALDVHTPDELKAAALAGRLRSVTGIGPATEASRRIAAEPRQAERGSRFNGPGVRGRRRAARRQVAGDPRRWADTSFELAVVVAGPPEPSWTRSETRAIVAVVRHGLPRVGVMIEASPSSSRPPT